MKASQIIDEILNHLQMKAASFAASLGYDRPQKIYDIQKGKTKSISQDLVEDILSVYPQFSRIWLLTGEGNMVNEEEFLINKTDRVDISESLNDAVLNTDENIKERLALFLSYAQIEQDKFGKIIGVSIEWANNLGDSIRSSTLSKIKTSFPELNTVWLLTGEGNMLKNTENYKEHANMTDSLSDNPPVNEDQEINKSHMNERLQIIVDEKFHCNKAAFARALGVPVASIRNYLGERSSTPPSDLLEKIAKNVPNVNLAWLLTGNGEPFLNERGRMVQSLSQMASTGEVSVAALIKSIENLSDADKIRAEAQYEQAEANNRYSRVIEKLADRLDATNPVYKKEGTNS